MPVAMNEAVHEYVAVFGFVGAFLVITIEVVGLYVISQL